MNQLKKIINKTEKYFFLSNPDLNKWLMSFNNPDYYTCALILPIPVIHCYHLLYIVCRVLF